jgi:CMP-N-acetylneuraminic acid synthetase
MTKIYAFIPARSGSERVVNKNLRLLGNKPLLQHTLDLINHIPQIEKTFISTDYKNIHENINLNESVYIVNRPSEIAQSTSLDIDWILHLIDYIADDLPDLIILLRPTSPFRTADFVNSAISNLINNPGFDSSRSVHLVKEHPDKMWRKHEDSIVPYNSFNLDEKEDLHSQQYKSLDEVFIQTSSLEILRTTSVIKNKKLSGNKVLPIYSDYTNSFSIDYEIDYKIAEMIMNKTLII